MIVAKLTKAQRNVIRQLDGPPALPSLKTFSANAAFNLVRAGITRLVFDPRRFRDRYELTPLGLRVRSHLIEQEGRR